ncbi:MAG: CRISPR-associated endonuclease Cas2 [Flavobacteriia bacterium]|nr:CRISPR-associated endonuclease Cas2 [Flavobacteriia bacterium]
MHKGRNTAECINSYRAMWLFVLFDLPVQTKKQRRVAAQFRKRMLQEGFNMMQFSVYTRHCPSREALVVHSKRVKRAVPHQGQVTLMAITDKQYGRMVNIQGGAHEPLSGAPAQLELF